MGFSLDDSAAEAWSALSEDARYAETGLSGTMRDPQGTQGSPGSSDGTVIPTPSSYCMTPEKQQEDVWASRSQSTDAPDHHALVPYGLDFPSCKELAELPLHGMNRPANVIAWETSTHSRLQEAKQLSHEVRGQLGQNSVARLPRKFRDDVQTGLVMKMGGTNDLAKGLQDRLFSVEDTTRNTGLSLLSLRRARQSYWAPLSVVEKRLELRKGRPLQELLRDDLQDALELEHRFLVSARQELAGAICTTKDYLATLDATKNDLLEDLHHKRQSRRIDRTCFLDGGRRTPDADRLVLPTLAEVHHYGLPPSPKGADPGTGPMNDEQRNTNTRVLIGRAIRAEEETIHVCNKNGATILRIKGAAAIAEANTSACLSKRVEEYREMKKRLDNQVVETESMMCSAERSLQKCRQRLHTHQAPLDILSKQLALREGRAHTEHIRDGVHERLEDHLDGIKQSAKVLVDQVDGTQDLLDRLIVTRKKLVEDLRCKMVAMRIDEACVKVLATHLAIQPPQPQSPGRGRGSRPSGSQLASAAAMSARRIKGMQQRAERDVVNHRDLSEAKGHAVLAGAAKTYGYAS